MPLIELSVLLCTVQGFNPISDICSSSATQSDVNFNEDTQYTSIQYENEDIIQQYDNTNNDLMDWPYSRNIWGFKAASITMVNKEKQFSENILISSIPIYIPHHKKSRTITRPRGKYFYVFSSLSSSNEEAIVIEFRLKDESHPIRDFKIMTKPTFGASDGKGTFCDTQQTEGMCFGESKCCDAFEQLLTRGAREGSKCRTILLCPKGVLRIDLYDFSPKAAENGLDNFEIYGASYDPSEQDQSKELQLLFETESDYFCPDGSYHIRLSCPRISTSFKGITGIGRREKGNVDEDAFRECPFCSVPGHKYQIIFPSDGIEIRGKCSEKDKKTRPAFGFMNKKRDYMSCCIETHTRVSNHINGAYKKHPIEKEIENSQNINDDVFKSENKYEEQQRNEVREEEKKQSTPLYDSGKIRVPVTHSVVLGILVAFVMIVASSYIYFK